MIDKKLTRRLTDTFGISVARFEILSRLATAAEPLMMSEISSQLRVTGGNITTLVDAMEKDNLVSRVRSTSDRRVIAIELTGTGRELFERASGANDKWVSEALGKLTVSQLTTLHEILGELRASAVEAGMA
jgi:DNA-binding MarR family transcriptional regulator